jgi:hypothetical protein
LPHLTKSAIVRYFTNLRARIVRDRNAFLAPGLINPNLKKYSSSE